jgi:hypothetical protein
VGSSPLICDMRRENRGGSLLTWGQRREKWVWLIVNLGVEMGEVGVVHCQEKKLRKKKNRDMIGWGGGLA